MDTDEILWEGMRHGNQSMFLELYKRYYPLLLFAGYRQKADALIKDIIQQLFLELWEKRNNIQQAENVKSYLFISFLRKLTHDLKKSARVVNIEITEFSRSADGLSTPEESLIFKNEHLHLTRSLADQVDKLPERQRELIVLRFYEGLSYDLIAARTGLSQRTVYNTIHEALKKLRLEMAERKESLYLKM